MRYFELRTEDDAKFWNIDIDGKYVIKAYGKIGKKGTEIKDEYLDETYAKKDALKLIQKKLKEGYVELPGGDNDHEKWHDEATAAKAAKAAAKPAKPATPAKVKEKRVPITLNVEAAKLKTQTDFDAKASFKNMKIVASHICVDNEISSVSDVCIGLAYLGNGYLAAVSQSWQEVTDLFNLQKGTCCRITPPDEERRVAAVLMDENYLYAMAIKGFEAESRNLVKYDINTNEIVWTCGSSASSITPRFIQDKEYIYSSDVKMLYIISKATGKTVTKVEVASKMDKNQKFYSNTANRFISVHAIDGVDKVLCGSLVNIALVDPSTAAKVWEISAKEYGKIIAYGTLDNKLYLLGDKNKFFVINIANGSIMHKQELKHGFTVDKGTNFYLDGGELCAILHNDEQRILFRVNPADFTCRADDYTDYLPAIGRYQYYIEVVKDGLIFANNRKQLVVVEKNTGNKVASLDMPSKYDEILDCIVVGDCIYVAQALPKAKDQLTAGSAVLHQIK